MMSLVSQDCLLCMSYRLIWYEINLHIDVGGWKCFTMALIVGFITAQAQQQHPETSSHLQLLSCRSHPVVRLIINPVSIGDPFIEVREVKPCS